MNFSTKLFTLRLSRNITRQYLAEKIGFSVNSIRCWEAGKSSPGYYAIIELCRFFQISADQLLELNEVQK